ncbi:MAG: hypothetical protein IJQ16_00460, partial [Selenomonadaceae bacterium]|nr:hypothetical protein [Selenomonadaceae bacterium]
IHKIFLRFVIKFYHVLKGSERFCTKIFTSRLTFSRRAKAATFNLSMIKFSRILRRVGKLKVGKNF